MADAFARVEIKKQEKHLKAYIRGDRRYKLYGQTFPVISPDIFKSKDEEE